MLEPEMMPRCKSVSLTSLVLHLNLRQIVQLMEGNREPDHTLVRFTALCFEGVEQQEVKSEGLALVCFSCSLCQCLA